MKGSNFLELTKVESLTPDGKAVDKTLPIWVSVRHITKMVRESCWTAIYLQGSSTVEVSEAPESIIEMAGWA